MLRLGEVSTATITNDGRYRYDLVRTWGDPEIDGLALWVMLNPSTATADEDDATMTRVIRFTRREGLAGCAVVNLFSLRARNPHRLLDGDDPLGPDGFASATGWLLDDRVKRVVAAWGAWGAHKRLPHSPVRTLVENHAANNRWIELGGRGPVRAPVVSLGVTQTGEPCHPLYLSGTTEFTPWP